MGVMSPAVLALWILVISIASCGFVVTFYQKRTLVFPRSYLAYFAAAGTFQLLVTLIRLTEYEDLFWVCDVVHNLLLCTLSAEIVYRLRDKQTTWVLGYATVVILTARFVFDLPNDKLKAISQLAADAAVLGGVLLSTLFLTRASWTKEYKFTAAGVWTLLAVELFILSVGQPANLSQVGPMLGLVLLIFAGHTPRQ